MGSYSYAIMVFYKYITLSGLVFIFAFIPKGLNHSAQGCPACGATLGMLPQKTVNPERVEACVNPKQTVHRIQWHTDVTMFGIPPEMMFCYDAVAGP